MKELRENDTFIARTHADFLNKVFGTHYKGWMKSVWTVTDDVIVWMVRFDRITRDGWRNHFLSDDLLCQENVYGKKLWNGVPIDDSQQLRLVFAIMGEGKSKTYTFKGVFRYETDKSNPQGKEYFRKMSSVF